MSIKSIKQVKSLKGKRVLLRVDFNVSLGNDFKVDRNEDYRLVKSLPTLKYLIKKKAKVILVTHLGRPNGQVSEDLRLDPVAVRLSQLLDRCIYKADDVIGAEITEQVTKMSEGEILMLENVRFHPGEEKGSQVLAKQLAKLADIYVNDAFAVSHRNHASVSTIQKYLPSYAGLLLEQEITNLAGIFNKPKQPLIVIVGGAKISTKIQVIKRFLEVADQLLLGGALANTVLKVMGMGVGKSVIEPKMFKEIKKIQLTDNRLRVPVDGLMAKSFKAKKGRADALADIKSDEYILDIGPDTVKLYSKILKQAQTVVWNGPMGLMENPAFAKGTNALVKILAKSQAKTIVGGGETVTSIRKLGLEDKFNFISTGGGAMLEFLEGKELPGLKSIIT